ncbi:hypothetical protein HPHPH34_0544 [Helicobacter pylori Hp H-34]|uniref:Uncharacterized protein n=1 Tax=Helicobacter pylori Hp H-34 TaxID=992069 RepID=I9VY95_HELPX|nr:hypothetical protein HPHPH34_0544 [Helicobacter pylori Hp H-34]
MHAQSLNLEIEPAKKGVTCNLIVFFFKTKMASLFYGIISDFNKKGCLVKGCLIKKFG